MAIKITRIEVEHLGPLPSFKNDLRDVTLIYGGNERGKTFLVEFILKSLFKNLPGFKNEFRITKPGGKVVVSGLESELVTFSPNSKNKLETKWKESGQGMPPNIARLLVVKGGDTNIDKKTDDGISQDAIREFLSSQGILDSIQKNIRLKGTREAKIEAGEIHGSNFGDLGKRNDARADVDSINQLLDRVSLELADGDVISLNKRIAQVEDVIRKLEAAKKYAAYRLAQEKQEVDGEIKRLEDGKFHLLDKNFGEYLRKQEFLAAKQEEKEVAFQRGVHYPWLKDAVVEYQRNLEQTTAVRRPTYLIVAFSLLLVSVLLILFGQRWPAVIGILLSIGSGFWHFQQVRRLQVNQAEAKEIEQIRVTYSEKFNEPCKDLPTMRVKLEAIASDYHAAQQIDKDIEKARTEINRLANEIQQGLKELGKSKSSPDLWDETISKLRHDLSDLLSQAQQLKTDLARYDVDPSDYIDSDPGITYKRDDYAAATAEKERLESERTTLEQALQNLKSEVQAVVRDHSSTDWGDLIHKLREMKLEKLEEYKRYTTEILAGNLLNQAIEQTREQEDEKISENLDSEIVRGPLGQITKHYVGVEIEDGSFRVIDEFNQTFDFADLSTGTREQIFLALRIGFARKVMQGDTAFMILDDAFQHSDWERRPRLVDTAFELANQGWQIIYFTMDDHIRDLFDQRAKKARKDTYVRIDL